MEVSILRGSSLSGLNADERRTILDFYLSRLNTGPIDCERLVRDTARFTPADIQYLFEQVAQCAFEHEISKKEDCKVTTESILQIMQKMRPSLTDEIVEEFEKDSLGYARVLFRFHSPQCNLILSPS